MIDAKHHAIEIRPLPSEDGGGWLATFNDLPGCIGDGETPEAAVADGYAAATAWLAVAQSKQESASRESASLRLAIEPRRP